MTLGPWCSSTLSSLSLILVLLVPAVPRSPREIKSYHLIDFSALDSPQMHRKADSSPMFSSLLDLDQDFTELGKATF